LMIFLLRPISFPMFCPGVSLFAYQVEFSRSHQPLSLCRSFFGFIGLCLDGPAPGGVTHQVQGHAGKRALCSSAAPSVLNGPEDLRFQAVSKSCLTGLMVVSPASGGTHSVGGQYVDHLVRLGWNGCPIRPRGLPIRLWRGSPFQPAPYPNNFTFFRYLRLTWTWLSNDINIIGLPPGFDALTPLLNPSWLVYDTPV
jgi:hypothetical protein